MTVEHYDSANCDCVPRHEYDDLREQLGEIDELRAEVERCNESAVAMLKVITENLPRVVAQRDDARAEVKRLQEWNEQLCGGIRQAAQENERLRAALEGVLAEADRKTDAFDRAHAALE